jgi:hypothetical protein
MFSCTDCVFKCSKKSEWERHISTRKHLNRTKKTPDQVLYVCDVCNKQYTARNSLFYHKKTCTKKEDDILIDDIQFNKEFNEKDTSGLLIEIMKSNKEMQAFMLEQQKELNNTIMELVKKQGNVTTTITTNNQFNLNFFLNEQCKNAVNIQDFLDNIHLTVADIEATGRLGYVNGISRIFINKLKEMDIFTRPLHCTDLKRETVYIRDKDMWEKEKDEQPRLKKLVKIMARKNLKQLPAWQEKNPQYAINNTPQNEEFTQLSLTCLGSYTEEEDEKDTQKILRNVLKEIRVDRN